MSSERRWANAPPRLAISTFRILLSPKSQAPIFHEAFALPPELRLRASSLSAHADD
jgi:hypothetical protein